MRRIGLVLVLSGTTPAAHSWYTRGVAWARPLREHASTASTARRACNLETTRVPLVRGEGGRHGDATASESCETNISRQQFLRRVTAAAALGAAAATGAALPRASLAGEGRRLADVKKGIEADFLSRYSVAGSVAAD